MNNLTYDQSVTVLDALTTAYEAWMTAQNLDRGSADEVLLRAKLTSYERTWLTAFVALWEASNYVTSAGPNRYSIGSAVTFPWQASKREESLGSSELKRGYRVIGGDKADLHFDGYDVDDSGTELRNPVVVSYLTLTPEEAFDIATEIVQSAYTSVGTECVEHS